MNNNSFKHHFNELKDELPRSSMTLNLHHYLDFGVYCRREFSAVQQETPKICIQLHFST